MHCVRTLLAMAVMLAGVALPARAAEHYIVHLSLAEETASDEATKSEPRRLGAPTIAVREGVAAEIRVGGSTKVGEEDIEHGTFAKLRVTKRTRDGVEVQGKLEVSSINSSNADSVVRQSTTVYFNRSIPLNKTVRIVLKDADPNRQWCDVKVEVAEND